jgi:predicted anti-sigma-YlaC factor YlaD
MLALLSSCSFKQYAVNSIGDMLASGGSVYESDDDIILVGEALPFSLKLVESLLAESPQHRGLLLTASRGFVLYAYAYVHFQAEQVADDDLEQARQLRQRARRLYLRAHDYAMRGLELTYPGLSSTLLLRPDEAVTRLAGEGAVREVPLMYWAAASLGLAISVSKDSAGMLARLPEVDALLRQALTLDEAWDNGTLHQFMVSWAGAQRHGVDQRQVRRHYERALALSGGSRAGLHLALAEALSIPNQDRAEFRTLIDKALAVDPDAEPSHRLLNLLAQRRAQWLLRRIDELFLE